MKMASSQSEPISHSMRFPKNGSSTLRLFFFSGEGGTQTALNKNGGLSSLSNAVMLEKDIFGWSHQTPFALRALFLSHLRERQHWRNPSGVVHCRLRIRICIGYPQSQLGLFVWSARSDQHPNDVRACMHHAAPHSGRPVAPPTFPHKTQKTCGGGHRRKIPDQTEPKLPMWDAGSERPGRCNFRFPSFGVRAVPATVTNRPCHTR